MPTIHSSSRQFLLRLGVSNLPKSADQTLTLTRDENFFQLPITAPTIDNSLDNNIVEEDGQGLDKAVIANKDRPGQERITINTDQNDTVYSERKETSPTSVDDFPTEKNSDDALGADDTAQGAFDVPIAERLKLRREKRAAAKKDDTPTEECLLTTPNMSLRKRKSLVSAGIDVDSSRKKRIPRDEHTKKKDAPVNNDMSMSKSSRSLRKRKSSVLDSDKDSNTAVWKGAVAVAVDSVSAASEMNTVQQRQEEKVKSKRQEWTTEEDEELVKLVRIHGENWKDIFNNSRILQRRYALAPSAIHAQKSIGMRWRRKHTVGGRDYQPQSTLSVPTARSIDKEAGVLDSDNKDSSAYLGGEVAVAAEEEDEALYSDVAELKIVPKEDRLNNANGIPFCKVEGCPKQGRTESDRMCRSHFNMFKKAGRRTKVVEELPPVKRGRGRPKKQLEVVRHPSENEYHVKQEKLLVVNEPSLVKRGRGRPKKNPIVDQPAPFEKRGRGRPRKTSISSQLPNGATKQQIAEKKTMTLRKHRVKSSKLRTDEIGADDIGEEQTSQSGCKPTSNNSALPNGVKEMPSGNYEVSLGYHGQRRVIGTYTSLDDAVQANKVARSMLITERGVHPSVEQIGTNIQSAKDAVKAAGITASNQEMIEKRGGGRPRETSTSSQLSRETTKQEQTSQSGCKPTSNNSALPNGVKEMPSGNYEVSLSYHGQRRIIGTYITLDDAVQANKVARSMLITERGVHPSVEQIGTNIQSAKEAIKASGITASNLSGKQTKRVGKASKAKDIDFSSVGIKLTVSGSWEVIVCYQGKPRSMGTYRMKAEAALANEVSRNMLAVTRSSLLSPEESIQNVKLAKEAALKAVSEMCTIEDTQEYGTLAPGRWQTDKVFDEWLRDRKSKWKQQRPRGATEKETSESITIECSETDYHHTKTICSTSSATIGDDESNDANDKRLKDLSMVEKKQGKKKKSMIATLNSEYWNSLGLAPTVIEEKKAETVERKEKNKIVVCGILKQKPAVVHLPHHSCLETDSNGQNKIADTPLDRNGYAINEEGASAFETLWEKRTSANSNNEELEYEFFNGESNDQIVGLNSVSVVSLQNRKREEEEKELRLREADAVGGLLSLNLNGVVSSKVPGKGIKSPTAKDVLRGRGQATTSHEGNMKLRDEARKLRGDYQDGLEGRSEKKYQYSLELVERVRSYGGRFLEKRDTNDNLWYEMSEEDTRKKAAQVLREKRWE